MTPLFSLIALFVTASFGLYTLKANPENAINRAFALFMLSVSLYLFVDVENLSRVDAQSVFWQRFSYVSFFFVASTFVYFTWLFPVRKPFVSPFFLLLLLVPALLFLSFLFNDMLIENMRIVRAAKQPLYGVFFPFFSVYLIALFSYGAVNLMRTFGAAKDVRLRTQIAYVLTGVVIGGIIGLSSKIFPYFNIQSPSLSGASLVVLAGFIAYALLQEKPLDIQVLLQKSLLYYLLTAVVIGVYILGVKALGTFMSKVVGVTSFLFESLLIVAIGFTFKPLADSLEHFLNTRLFARQKDYQMLLAEFGEKLVHCGSLKSAVHLILQSVVDMFEVQKAFLWMVDGESKSLELKEFIGAAAGGAESFRIPVDEHLQRAFLQRTKPLEVASLRQQLRAKEAQNTIKKFEDASLPLVAPLVANRKLIGLLALGEKTKGTQVSTDEMDVLFTIATQSALVLENMQVYEEIRRAYQNLVQKERLAVLGELSAGLAHEIRNPLSHIRGSAQILSSSEGNPEKQQKFSRYIVEEVERLNNLLTDFLDFARPRDLELSPIDVSEVVERSVRVMEEEQNGVRIEKKYAQDAPKILADTDKLQQVFMNLIKNALEAMKDGGELTVTTQAQNGNVIVEVKDTGGGIPKDALDKIFNPFFTTKEAGTGLGLSIVSRIIEAHKGEIKIESEEGKGTKVVVTFPGF